MAEAKPLILAIDDEADVLETYRSVLGKKHKVVTAPSGKAALKELQKEPVSVVLLDIRMPAEDGIQVLKKIKAYDQDLEVIMVTASKDIASAVEAMKLGAFDYVSKPFDVKELQALIHGGHPVSPRADRVQHPDRAGHADAVGIRFDHGNERHPGPHRIPDRFQVSAKRAGANLHPSAAPRVR